jgi:hypothetical protein
MRSSSAASIRTEPTRDPLSAYNRNCRTSRREVLEVAYGKRFTAVQSYEPRGGGLLDPESPSRSKPLKMEKWTHCVKYLSSEAFVSTTTRASTAWCEVPTSGLHLERDLCRRGVAWRTLAWRGQVEEITEATGHLAACVRA